jgi:D-amino-acid dehydrogenase
MTAHRALGVQAELIGPDAVHQLEPNLPPIQGGAAFFPNAVFMADPAAMVGRLAAHVMAQAEIISARVDTITRRAGGVQLTGAGLRLTARKVIIAAGAHSRALAAMAGDRAPLDTERGYHVEWDMAAARLTRPTCPTARGFYLCPMTGRLRVAGTVELGGLTAPPSQHRIDALIAGARAIFPDLGTPSRVWMGFRPSMPDSRPVIGPSRGGDDVILAFGHGHIGLTLAPKTAAIVSDLIAGRSVDLAPCNPLRF